MTDLRRVSVVYSSTVIYSDRYDFPQEVVEGNLPDILKEVLYEYDPTVGMVRYDSGSDYVASVSTVHDIVINTDIRASIPMEDRLEHLCREELQVCCRECPVLQFYTGEVASWEFGVNPDPGYMGSYSLKHWTKTHIIEGARARGATDAQIEQITRIPLKELQAMFLVSDGVKSAGWIDGDRTGTPGRRTAYYSLDTESLLAVGKGAVQ